MNRLAYKGKLSFDSSDDVLNKGFEWAKQQALAYVFEGDHVGDWYEAALPNRAAFCMRDVSHHAAGAQALGLMPHNKNMMRRFAQGIAESRDFCSFWEIDKDYKPAPVDYTSDEDFWYNLPANFDVIDACWRLYLWSGDEEYIRGYDFNHFYDLSVTKYVERWDINGDGILERAKPGVRRGIPSYNEGIGFHSALVMVDLIAIQARGYLSYAGICRQKGDIATAEKFEAEAKRLQEIITKEWWDAKKETFFGAKMQDGSLVHIGEDDTEICIVSGLAMLYYDVLTDKNQELKTLEALAKHKRDDVIVEGMSHYPQVFYQNGWKEKGYEWLCHLISPDLNRREYPEVSFCAIGSYVEGLMGVKPIASTGTIYTDPKLLDKHEFAELRCLPVFGGSIDYRVDKGVATLKNETGREIIWNHRGTVRKMKDGETQQI